MRVYDTITAERRLLIIRIARLSDAEWATPSLCAGWDVRHVLAHLITPFLVSKPQLLGYAVKGRGVAGGMDLAARDIAGRLSADRMLETLGEHASSRFRPPGMPAGASLTDIVCHGADIRWALGDSTDYWGDPERLGPMLDFLIDVRARAGFVPRGRLMGLQLTATDLNWSVGEGPQVKGPGLALAMGILGRPSARPLLTGEGVGRLFD